MGDCKFLNKLCNRNRGWIIEMGLVFRFQLALAFCRLKGGDEMNRTCELLKDADKLIEITLDDNRKHLTTIKHLHQENARLKAEIKRLQIIIDGYIDRDLRNDQSNEMR